MGKVIKSNDNVGYKGNVTVKVVGSKNKLNKQYKVKNSGYQPLFDFIAYCLAGSFNASLCPNYIATYNGQEATLGNATVTCSRPIAKVSSLRADAGVTELTFTIPGTSMASGETNLLALYCDEYYTTYNTENKNPSAVVELTQPITVASEESVVIVWQLTVENK